MRFSPSVPVLAGAVLLVGCAELGPSNTPPTAEFAVACSELTCQLTDGSTDPDGTITAHAWDFGDGAVSTEPDPVHAYGAPGGQFIVRLTVTDNDGDTATTQAPVTVQPGNVAPVAAFSVSCTNLTCNFTDESTDPDAGGVVTSRAWSFGDGQTSSEQNPSHTYLAAGAFTARLTVTDDGGAAASAEKQINVALSLPDRSGTYERETPHRVAGRRSRYVLRADNTFELHDGTGADSTIYTGQWRFTSGWLGWDNGPGSAIILDFDGIVGDPFCFGEAFGAFLFDGHLAIAYCGVPMFQTGLEEGVYSSDPIPTVPGPPPPQSGQIVFVRDGAIYLANSDGGGVVQLTAGPNDHGPAWSPDGSRIAFGRSPAETGFTTAIYVMNADGSNLVQRSALGRDPTWSPDGEWIAFADGGISKVRADGPATTPITLFPNFGQASHPAWSPDGSRIAFTSDAEFDDILFSIWLMAPDGSQLTALTNHSPGSTTPGEHYQLAWSPDGQRVAYASCPWASSICSSSAVTVMSADGSGTVHLAAASGYPGITWSPNGQVIAFASSNAIEWVSADGSQRGRVLDRGHSPAWRPSVAVVPANASRQSPRNAGRTRDK